MSASREFPRGLTLTSNPGGNAQASVTFPASPDITWVLDNLVWAAYVNDETVAAECVIQAVSAGLTYYFQWVAIEVDSAQQNPTGTWSGKFQGGVGASMVVEFSGGMSAVSEMLLATAYPV